MRQQSPSSNASSKIEQAASLPEAFEGISMALTALDPKTALIVIDLQKGIVGYPVAHPIEGVIARSRCRLSMFASIT